MMSTFNHCNYIVHSLRNEKATKDGVTQVVEKVSTDLSEYDGESMDKVIIFAFSGHGGRALEIYANDRQKINVLNEIVKPPIKHSAVADIPKLFFFDACQGEYTGKHHFTHPGNYYIAYATLQFAYTGAAGSMWMPKLASRLRTKVSIQQIGNEGMF